MARKKKETTNKKVLKTGKEKLNTIDLPEECSAIVLTPDGKANVYISASSEDENGQSIYAPHEELTIALAAMIQNEAFVETTIKTFRKLFDAAIQEKQKPENSID